MRAWIRGGGGDDVYIGDGDGFDIMGFEPFVHTWRWVFRSVR